jgi:hypothetical protein
LAENGDPCWGQIHKVLCNFFIFLAGDSSKNKAAEGLQLSNN